jgi:hypothetical protein
MGVERILKKGQSFYYEFARELQRNKEKLAMTATDEWERQ